MISDEEIERRFKTETPISEVNKACEFSKKVNSGNDFSRNVSYGYYLGAHFASRLERIKTLEEVREIFLSNGSKITTMVKLDRLIEQAKSE